MQSQAKEKALWSPLSLNNRHRNIQDCELANSLILHRDCKPTIGEVRGCCHGDMFRDGGLQVTKGPGVDSNHDNHVSV